MRLRLPALLAAMFVSSALIVTPLLAQAPPAAPSQRDSESLPAPSIREARPTTVAFELFRGNRVYVESKLNGHDTPALLDTGASATTVDRAYARAIGLPKGTPIQGFGAGGPVEAEIVAGVTLEIGGMHFDNMTVAVMDLAPVARQLGRPLPLIVGRELFNATALAFDWPSSRLTITPSAQYAPPAGSAIVPLERRGPFNFVKVAVAGLPPIDALLDLGNGGALNLPSDYWAKQPVLANLRYAEHQSGGVGGLHATRAVTFPSVHFGGQRFEQVPGVLAGDSQGNQPQHGANLGIGILKQFNLTLDLGRDRLILRPLPNPPAFDRDRSGLRLAQDGAALTVSFASPQGPAGRAGVKAGDKIIAVDGTPIAADFFATAAGGWNRAAPGKPVTLTLADGRTVRFSLADYY